MSCRIHSHLNKISCIESSYQKRTHHSARRSTPFCFSAGGNCRLKTTRIKSMSVKYAELVSNSRVPFPYWGQSGFHAMANMRHDANLSTKLKFARIWPPLMSWCKWLMLFCSWLGSPYLESYLTRNVWQQQSHYCWQQQSHYEWNGAENSAERCTWKA